jgi:DNA-binding GntR family transcriptional regulator
MQRLQRTSIASQLATQIAAYIRAENATKGTRLVERKLAEHLRVSRSPVRSALRLLAEDGIVAVTERGGFVVADPKRAPAARPQAAREDEDAYLSIARDRLNGTLPDKVTESSLIRQYGLTKAALAAVLRRISGEGWIERLPGHGWMFSPMLTSMQAYEDSYRFRMVIEPAALLEPNFLLDRAALEECRAQQQKLADGDIWKISNAKLFEINRRLHETIVACSRNSFFIEGLTRLNKVRRLIEYRQSLDRKRALVRCREHLTLIDLLLAGKTEKAAQLMFRHLATVSVEKTRR